MNIHSAIIKGPRKEKLQDAFGIINKKHYSLIVVADGLGSAKHSDYGSKKAVVAVEKAIYQWRKLKKHDKKVLIQLIHFFWNLSIADSEYEKKDCLTTCLFAYIDKLNHRIILGQLGDGLIFFKSGKRTVSLKSLEDYNYTKALGSSKSYNDWEIRDEHYDLKDFVLIITTDGVSEDLVEEKEGEFAESLIQKLSSIKKNKRNKYLSQLLENWPTKFHTDDKTICIAWERKRK